MFIKSVTKKDKATGKGYQYYRLCQSYRANGKPRHRTVLNLGKLDGLHDRRSHKMLVKAIEAILSGKCRLFPDTIPDNIEKLAVRFYHDIVSQKKLDGLPEKVANNRFQLIDIESIHHREAREMGIEWLCYQAIGQLGLPGFLERQGWPDHKAGAALMHLISRCAYPASEHKTAQWIRENSGVSSLFGIPVKQVNRFQLYRASQNLLGIKEKLEVFLSHKTNSLFDLNDKIILYDLTNTYFEGQKEYSRMAQYFRSKEKRSDAKLICLALVVNAEGFVKYHKVLRGNISDPATLEGTIMELATGSSQSSRKPLVVIDAGIATEENLAMLKSKGYGYLCVTRSKLKEYEVLKENNRAVKITDKRKGEIELSWVEKPGCEDTYLYVRSEGKAKKETSMKMHFTSHYEDGLEGIRYGIRTKGGTKRLDKVWERIGRLKERYPSANRFYQIEVVPQGDKATDLKWQKKKVKTRSSEGVYFLRTTLPPESEETIWAIYNTIREIEASFRVLKTDLDIRPIFHQSDENSVAHVNLCVLAYQVVSTIKYQLKAKNIHHDWSNITRIMGTQKEVTTTMKNNKGETIVTRKCSQPSPQAIEIYQALNYRMQPYFKKSVLPETKIQNSS